MRKTYKYRLYPNKKQVQKLEWTLDTCRILYNSCLIDRKGLTNKPVRDSPELNSRGYLKLINIG